MNIYFYMILIYIFNYFKIIIFLKHSNNVEIQKYIIIYILLKNNILNQ